MLRLTATLIATTAARPWRTGWSVARGVDFTVRATSTATPITAREMNHRARGEQVCFIDEDWAIPAGTTVVRRFASLAAARLPEGSADETPGTAPMQAFWRIAAGPSRS